MKVIQTLMHLMKNSFHNRQLVIVNTARALKFLESYGSRQTKLWKVLSKYYNLLDHFHDLKTTLQAKFELLKTATSKNVQNLQETVQAQQAYNTILLGHIAALHTKLAHLNKQIQIHCICCAHQDGGSSQGSTRYSLPPARRWGGFNSNDQLNSSAER